MEDNPARTIKPYSQYFSGKAAVYRNALPHFNNDVIDITSLSDNEKEVAYQCLESMLNVTAFNRSIIVNYGIDEGLKHLYFESRNIRRNKGLHTLGFGFPLFISKQDKELLSLPLFIWPLSLEVTKKQGTWNLAYPAERPVRINPYFPHFIMMKYGIDIEGDLRELFQAPINASKLAGFCNDLTNTLDLNMTSQQVSLMPCPETNELDNLVRQDALQWSGVLGHFPFIPPQNKNDDINQFLRLSPKELTGHDFSTRPLDPWQASATAWSRENFITLVEGSAGTGKTHLLKHFVTNTIANGGKCLIVSEYIAALQAIQRSLSAQQFDNLLFLLSDELSDQVLLREVIKAKAKGKNPAAAEMPQSLRVLLDRMERRKGHLESQYRASRKPVFGDKGFAETLGLYLESSQLEPKELLNSYLNENDFTFEESEMDKVLNAISEAPGLFNDIGTLDHPLAVLNANIFLQYDQKEALAFIKSNLETYNKKATALQHRFIKLQADYAEALKGHYSTYFHDLRNKAFDLKEKISDYTSHFGSDLRKSGKGTLKLYGVFNHKFKEALAQRESIFETYEGLQHIFAEYSYFDHQFEKTNKNIDLISANLDSFTQHLRHWWQVQNESVKDELLRLTHKTAHPNLNFSDPLRNLEEDLENFIDELNNSRLFQLPLQCNMLTLQRKQKFLEDKMSVMEQTVYHLRDFNTFYPWQRFWFSQNTLTRKVIKALGRVNPGNWEAAFRSWYFNKALALAYDPDLPASDFDLEDYNENMTILRNQLPEEIHRIWAKKRHQTADNLKRVAEEVLSNKTNLKTIFRDYATEITDFLPVILATPKMAADISTEEPVFDYLLIDEAQNAMAESCIALFPLAKRVVVFTDPKTEIPGDAALPQVLRISGVSPCSLDNFHANRAADILRPENQLSITSQNINGRFEESYNTNSDEAEKVIHYLNTIEKTSARTFPSVGIVCLTVQQRDLITSYLLRIKQHRQTGAETIQQLERNGLGVFHVDELDGRLFDQVILSATFGESGIKTKQLTKSINRLNTPSGVAAMHKLLGCVKNELKIIHSIPKKYLDIFLEQDGPTGTFLLAGLIERVQSAEVSASPKGGTEVWNDQLERLLRQQNPEATFRHQEGFLIMQTPGDEQAKLLLTDGCFAQTPNTDFCWEFEQRQKWAAEQNLEVVPVWPVKWR